MIFIIGGAYQGKLEYAMTSFNLTFEDVFTCTDHQIDFSKSCIYKLEVFAKQHSDPLFYFQERRSQWQDSVLILEDIFCGIVPMGAELRQWRQKTGRLAQYLSKEANQVSRIFCGLEHRLK